MVPSISAQLQILQNAQASAAPPDELIPCPAMGSAGREYNLQEAMGLRDNDSLFKTLRVC